MVKKAITDFLEKENRYFEICEAEILRHNIHVQKMMSVVSSLIFLGMIILAKLLISGFTLHPVYYMLFFILVVFFAINQFAFKRRITFRKLRLESIIIYGSIYIMTIIIDTIPTPEAPAVLFPFFVILFVAIYTDKLIVYAGFITPLCIFCIVMDAIHKSNFFFSRDVFAIVASYIVTVLITVLFQNLRINLALNNADLEEVSNKAAEAEAEAIAANKAKSQFLSQMSHEIRTPINAILGMNELIIREYDDDTLVKYAHNIKSAGNTLLALINDVLDFSKIEAGKMELFKVEYDLAGMITELVSMVDERARNKGLELKVTVNEQMPHLLYGDSVRLKQVILNILTNAIKYTENGFVHMDFDYVVGSHLNINGTVELKISISDTGIGIREDDMEKLFSPFERLEEVRNRNVEGTGLGMSIVQKLLGLMGSELHVRSEYGKGSTFSFLVAQETRSWEPIGDFNEAYDKLVKSEEDYSTLFEAPDAKILIVDDNEVNLVVTKNLLKDTKIQTVTATSGKEALKLCDEQEFDLLLVDHRMPGMDGMEMLWRLRSNNECINQKKPSIALTANVFSGAREVYKNSGFEDYLSKPILGDSLERILLEYLPEEKVIRTTNKKYVKHVPTRIDKTDDNTIIEQATENINDVREDYSYDSELYAAIGLLMKRANISG